MASLIPLMFLLAISPIITAMPTVNKTAWRRPPNIADKTFNHQQSDKTLLLVAGIEGTGHHALCDFFGRHSYLDAKPIDARPQTHRPRGSERTEYVNRGRQLAMLLSRWWFSHLGDTVNYLAAKQDLRDTLLELKQEQVPSSSLRPRLISPCSYTSGYTGSGSGPGMFSFPNYAGSGRAINMPNYVALARMCEEIGLDLRIIALTRGPLASIVSAAVKRKVGLNGGDKLMSDRAHIPVQIKTMAIAAAALDAQLAALDPAFVTVVSYEDLTNGTASDVLRHLALQVVGLEETVLDDWENVHSDSSIHSDKYLSTSEIQFAKDHFAFAASSPVLFSGQFQKLVAFLQDGTNGNSDLDQGERMQVHSLVGPAHRRRKATIATMWWIGILTAMVVVYCAYGHCVRRVMPCCQTFKLCHNDL